MPGPPPYRRSCAVRRRAVAAPRTGAALNNGTLSSSSIAAVKRLGTRSVALGRMKHVLASSPGRHDDEARRKVPLFTHDFARFARFTVQVVSRTSRIVVFLRPDPPPSLYSTTPSNGNNDPPPAFWRAGGAFRVEISARCVRAESAGQADPPVPFLCSRDRYSSHCAAGVAGAPSSTRGGGSIDTYMACSSGLLRPFTWFSCSFPCDFATFREAEDSVRTHPHRIRGGGE